MTRSSRTPSGSNAKRRLHPVARANFAIAQEKHFILREERTFLNDIAATRETRAAA